MKQGFHLFMFLISLRHEGEVVKHDQVLKHE